MSVHNYIYIHILLLSYWLYWQIVWTRTWIIFNEMSLWQYPHDDHESARLEHKVIKILVPFTAAGLLGYVSSRLLPVTWQSLKNSPADCNSLMFLVVRQLLFAEAEIRWHDAWSLFAWWKQIKETVPTIAYPARQRSCHDQWRVAVAALALRLRQRRCCDSEHSQDMLLRSLVILPSFGSTANSCWMDQQKWKVSCTLLVGAGDIQF